MTLNKLYTALLAVAAALGMASCTEEAEYTPAPVPDTAQVYFSKDDQNTTVDLTAGQSTFNIYVYRPEAGPELTVPVTATDPSGLFTVASTAKFADGQPRAAVMVTFDFDALVPSKAYTLSLAIDAAQGTPYGSSTLDINVSYAPWSEWTAVGSGTYTFTQYSSGTQEGVVVERRDDQVDPTNCQYRFVGLDFWGNKMNLVVDCNTSTNICSVAQQEVENTADYGMAYISDLNNYNLLFYGEPNSPDASTYDPETGTFALYIIYYSADGGYWGYGYEYMQLDGFTVPSITLSDSGHYIATDGTDYALINALLSSEVAKVKYAIEAGELDDTAIETALATLAADQEAATTDESGYLAFPLTEAGKYTVLAIGYDAMGNQVCTSSLVFRFNPAGSSVTAPDVDQDPDWTTKGWVMYTDELVASYLSMDVASYYVKLQEDNARPGRYRLVNPYGPDTPNGAPYVDPAENYFLVIDASVPDQVVLEYSDLGADYGYGMTTAYSNAAWYLDYDYSREEVAELGFFGTITDGLITFPANQELVKMANWDNGEFYQCNANGMMSVDISEILDHNPDAASMRTAAIAKSAKTIAGDVVSRYRRAHRHPAARL